MGQANGTAVAPADPHSPVAWQQLTYGIDGQKAPRWRSSRAWPSKTAGADPRARGGRAEAQWAETPNVERPGANLLVAHYLHVL